MAQTLVLSVVTGPLGPYKKVYQLPAQKIFFDLMFSGLMEPHSKILGKNSKKMFQDLVGFWVMFTL